MINSFLETLFSYMQGSTKSRVCLYSNGGPDGDVAPMNGEETSQSISGGLIEELADMFDGELKPVAPKAQKKVPMPDEYVYFYFFHGACNNY